jgi:ABC-type dipeptide/oligopeptide/nickel transport system permease component
MLRYLYLVCFISMLSFTAMAATPAKQVKVKRMLNIDTTVAPIRHFDKAALKQYSSQKEFHYNDGGYVGESLWDRFWRWFWDLFTIDDKKTAGEVFETIIKYTLIALGAAALIFLILRLIGIDAFNVIKGKSLAATLPYDESDEDIYAIDLDAEVEKAINQQNYRFAVRLLYLKLLRQLSDAGKIHWEINKTNSIYIDELTDAEQRIAFKLVTRQFEYVWYGGVTIDADVFKKINVLFTDFKVKTA